jgi:hypothetical protein
MLIAWVGIDTALWLISWTAGVVSLAALLACALIYDDEFFDKRHL